MKQFFALVLSCLLLLCLAACHQTSAENMANAPTVSTPTMPPDTTAPPETTQPPAKDGVSTLPEGLTLAGVSLYGMTPAEAAAAVKDAISTYTLTLQADGRTLALSAEDIALTLDEAALADYLSALEAGQEVSAQVLATCDTAKVIEAVESELSTSAKNATIAYYSRQQQFIVIKPENGRSIKADGNEDRIAAAVGALQTEAALDVTVSTVRYKVNADDPRLPAALEKANRYLTISLAYTYEAAGVPATTVALTKGELADFVYVDKDLQVSLSDSEINSYVSNMAKKYCGDATPGLFVTSYGTQVNHTVQYYGASVDSTALAADIKSCMENYISGTRTAPYLDAISDKPYGGNYVEIDLSSQTLWVYKDGRCVVRTPIVSGNISKKKYTTTGVYRVYSKVRNTWLVGRDFRDYVHYWIAFNGNIGIHDATWRDEFGDEIYRYNGSHGCVNLPLGNAATVYANISKGTMVICYGGTRDPGSFTQELTGTAQYTVAEDAAAFSLDVSPKYRGTEISYTSEDPDVVTVSKDGLVTVKGTGTAMITVTSKAVGSMSAAAFQVQVTVISTCQDGRHTVAHWENPALPCQSGVQTGICDKCGQPQEQTYTPTDHDFGNNATHCAYGCGAENPNYQPPESSEPENAGDTTGEPA